MMSGITWYDVLGVLPDAAPEDILAAWQARKAALQPAALAGAPPDVLPAADRARQVVDEAWGVSSSSIRPCFYGRVSALTLYRGLPARSWLTVRPHHSVESRGTVSSRLVTDDVRLTLR
jgi:hypothetical protein